MPKKQPGKPTAPPPPPTPPESARSFTPLLLVAFALVVAAVAVFVVRSVGPRPDAQSQSGAAASREASASAEASADARPQPDAQTPPASTSSPAQTSAVAAAPADPPPAAALKPHPQANLPALPFIGVPPARPIEVVRAVFQFAAEHPEVLSYVPCYCGCESQGHRGSEDCFVASRDAKGDVDSWDPHGMT